MPAAVALPPVQRIGGRAPGADGRVVHPALPSPRRAAVAAGLVAAAALVGAVLPVGVLPGAAPPAAGAGASSALVTSADSDGAGSVASTSGPGTLVALRPGSDAAPDVPGTVARLRALGLDARAGEGWTLRVPGDAAQVRRALASVGQADAAVVPSDPTPLLQAAALPGEAVSPADLLDAYAAPASGGAGVTVAVLAVEPWSPAETTTWAREAGVPLAPGQLETVSVAGAPATVPAGGAFEPALDTQAVLATAPQARQRVYVASNDAEGLVELFARVAQDAEQGRVQVVSMSYGRCEQGLARSVVDAVEVSVARALAAGATVLASSGDRGGDDCGDGLSRLEVSYPASSPRVVGVGGTRLTRAGSGWTETAWGPGAAAPSTPEGSGGGLSAYFPRPAYQSSLPGSGRRVPDVASLADTAPGFPAWGTVDGRTGWFAAGGTSVGPPVQAGLLARALSGRAAGGAVHGAGDVLPALYGAPSSAFRDVVAGHSGTHAAGPGHDLVTGRGSPRWDQLVGLLPVVGPPAAPAGPTTPGPTTPGPTTPETPPGEPAAPVVGTFADDDGNAHEGAIETMVREGITTGCGTDGEGRRSYCPAASVTRGQMATFLSRALHLPPATRDVFTDDDGTTHEDGINRLAEAGVTAGLGGGRYGPNGPVTRDQMATFLTRALQLEPAQSDSFDDDAGNAHQGSINALAASGITQGCDAAARRYCPAGPVRRDQMASFLARAIERLR